MTTPLDLWRPRYKKGDLVWVLSRGRFFKGEVVRQVKYYGSREEANKEQQTYRVFTQHAAEISPNTRGATCLSMSSSQFYPRYAWENKPLERVMNHLQEDNLEKLLSYVKEVLAGGAAGHARQPGSEGLP